ncbi:hypothetical protein BH10BAC6_BH10BAC6_08150 [soil metagenome]
MEHRERTLLPVLTLSFLVSALFGVVLRMTPFIDLPLSYEHLRHAHSHWGFLGWALASFSLIVPTAFEIERLQRTWYRVLWIVAQCVALVAVALLASFGYGMAAIIALTVHSALTSVMLLAIVFTLPNAMSSRFIQLACVASVASLAGPLFSSVNWYMSMQVEGFFIAAVFGIVVRMIERDNGRATPWLMIPALLCLIGALFPTSDVIAAALRATSVVAIVLVVIRNMPRLLHVLSGTSTMVIAVVLGAFIVRSMATLILAALALFWHDVSSPALRILLLHLVFLGILTPVVFVSLRVWFSMRIARFTWIVYTIGVTGTLLVLLSQAAGMALPRTPEALLLFAGIILCAAVMIVPASVRALMRNVVE